jgi:hypothetical protein
MRKEFEEKLVRRWPTWSDLQANPMSSAMARGFECGDGWFNILWGLCVELEPLVAELERETGERFSVVQVKEKFGTLRFYVSQHTGAIDERIEAAALEALRTCEVCGRPGSQGDTYGCVACEEHAERGTSE